MKRILRRDCPPPPPARRGRDGLKKGEKAGYSFAILRAFLHFL